MVLIYLDYGTPARRGKFLADGDAVPRDKAVVRESWYGVAKTEETGLVI